MSKHCNKCNRDLPFSKFNKNKNSKDNFTAYCNNCRSTINKKRYFSKKIKIRKLHLIYINKEANFIRSTIKNIFKHSRMFPKFKSYNRKGWVPKITLEEMYGELLLHIQLMQDKFPGTNGRLCRYCEQPWTTIRNASGKGKVVKSNFSVDRFDTNKTYVKGNIIFCCTKCNSLKHGSTKKMWIKFLEIDKELHEENKTI
jgi:hypothetical protein